MAEDKDSKGFVVKDKRRFDSSGNEKSESEMAKQATQTVSDKTAQQSNKPPENTESIRKESQTDKPSEGDYGEMNFTSFIMSLATQAMMQLGEIKPPPGMTVEIDKQAARQSIDILGMLQEKTKNNLDKEEAHLLEQILHSLRLSYVKAIS